MPLGGVGLVVQSRQEFSRQLTLEEPAFGVSWFEAVRYCRWLTEQAGMAESDQCYSDPGPPVSDEEESKKDWRVELDRRGFRLPTEGEWEMVCRGGTNTAYSFGNDVQLLGRYGWFVENSEKRSHAVGRLRPSARGLFDTHGNILEWCHDWYGDYGDDAADPVGADAASDRVLRGGAHNTLAGYCRPAWRGLRQPTFRSELQGFRVAAVPFSQAGEAASEAGSAGREGP